jgi:hypothetical protein
VSAMAADHARYEDVTSPAVETLRQIDAKVQDVKASQEAVISSLKPLGSGVALERATPTSISHRDEG